MAILRTILHRLFFIVMLVIVYSTANAIDIVQGSRTDVTFNATPPTEYENGTTIPGNDTIGISMLWSTTTADRECIWAIHILSGPLQCLLL